MVTEELSFSPGDITSISFICPKCKGERLFRAESLPSGLDRHCANPACSGDVQEGRTGRDAMQIFKLLLESGETVRLRISKPIH